MSTWNNTKNNYDEIFSYYVIGEHVIGEQEENMDLAVVTQHAILR